MDDETKVLLRAILKTQQEHLEAFRTYTDKATKYQETALQVQEAAVRRQKTQIRGGLIGVIRRQ